MAEPTSLRGGSPVTDRDPALRGEDARSVLDSLMADLPGVVYRCLDDEHWTMLAVSPNVEALTGYPPAALVENAETSWAELVHPADLDTVRQAIREAREAGEPFRTTYRLVTRSGEVRWVLEQGQALGTGDEPVLAGYVQDVTGILARRLTDTQEHLAEARRETRLLELLHTVTVTINEHRDLDDALAAVLPGVCRTLGFTLGHAWRAGPGAEAALRSAEVWYLDPAVPGLEAFRRATDGDHWDVEAGLPGRVRATGQAEWVLDAGSDPSFFRVGEEDSPVRSGLGVPVLAGDRVVAVLELYTHEPLDRDPLVERILCQVGLQLGRVWERQEADRDQRFSAQLFGQLAIQTDMVFWLASLDGEVLYLSSGFERLMGAVRAPRDWKDLIQLAHPGDRDRLARLLARSDRAPYEVEYRVLRDDGTVRWVRQRAFSLVDAEGEVFRVGGMAEDITAERRAVSRFERTNRLLAQTFSSLEEAVLVVGLDAARRVVVEANQAAERMFGWSRAELLGRTTLQLHVDEEHFRRFGEEGDELLRSGGIFRATFPMRRRDGTVFQAEQTVTLLDADAGIDGGGVSVVRDVSERAEAREELRRTERHFQALIESSLDVVGIMDQDLITRYVSPSVTAMLGYDPEEMVGTTGVMRLHPEDREAALEEFRPVLRTPGAVHKQEVRMLHKDGSVRHVEARTQNLVDEPSVGGIVVNLRDVTEEKNLELQLHQAQKMEAVGRLAGGIAHDFNNLLTVIRGQADFLLLDLPEDGEVARELGVIRSAADRAARLTNQLLAFGREQVLRPRVVDLGTVVGSMHELLERVLGEDIVIETELGHGVPPVRVDPSQLEQVVMNLVVNARAAMPEGGHLRIGVTSEEVSEDDVPSPGERVLAPGTVVRLDIADTGVGMSPETQAQIFEPFFTTRGDQGGSGLGLATSYGIVRQSGGTIQVESEEGVGTTFTLRFPAADRPRESMSESADADAVPEVGTGRILLVEDDPSVLRVSRKILERAGHQVRTASDAPRGRSELKAHAGELDVLVTDLVLPGGSGRDLVDQVLQRHPHIAVVVVSGYAEGSPGQRGDLPEEVAFLQKPFTPDGLTAAVAAKLAEARDGRGG